MSATAEPASKRQKPDLSIEDFDDEELLALAKTQTPEPAGLSSAAAWQSANTQKGTQSKYALPTNLTSSQEALDEEQEIAELVRLANSTLPSLPHAAGQHSMDEMPESSTTAAERMQEASTSVGASTEAPCWSGANINGDSMSVTLQDGRRAFCKLHDKPGSFPSRHQHRHGKLLSLPISSLMQTVEQEAFAKAINDSEMQATAADVASAAHPRIGQQQAHQQALWVDKYSPKSFFELLSDEQINRAVVRWVKSWDACVHRKQAVQTGPMAAAQQQQGPEQKLLLLSGPPGSSHLSH